MLSFTDKPQEIAIVDETGHPILAGDEERRYFEGSLGTQVRWLVLLELLDRHDSQAGLRGQPESDGPLYLQGNDPYARHRLDDAPFHRAVRRQMVSVLP